MEPLITKNIRVLVLLQAGFDAYFAITLIKELRVAGIAVLILGPTAGLVRDMNGVRLCAEKSLSDFTTTQEDRLLIIPGGKSYYLSLLTDPRVYQLFAAINDNEGFILVPDEVQLLIDEMAGKRPYAQARFIFLENNDPQIISADLINHLSG